MFVLFALACIMHFVFLTFLLKKRLWLITYIFILSQKPSFRLKLAMVTEEIFLHPW